MNFIVRSVKREDLAPLYNLSRQFTLLNLPADKKVISEKIELSLRSFDGKEPMETAEYVFVVEDLESGDLAGSALIIAKNGTEASPSYSFKVLKKERFSGDLGVGFIHQVLRLRIETDGPSEVGGLVVDRSYRRRPEKVGRLMSLSRFLYIGLHKDRFDKTLHSEMAPPLTDEGRSEFWEALGRRFTGMPYKEADAISQENNNFIRSLFPEEDIYLCLLDSKARLVLGRVGVETQPALHLLNRVGFEYFDEVDPFDGGPHLSCPRDECTLIKNGLHKTVRLAKTVPRFLNPVFIAKSQGAEFRAGQSLCHIDGDDVYLPEVSFTALGLSEGDSVYLTPSDGEGGKKND